MSEAIRKVLVEIPPNQTSEHMRIQIRDADKIKKTLSEARSDPSHWFHGLRIIDNEQDWPRYGYKKNQYGNPVRDPELKSLAKVKYDEYERDKELYNDADENPTVGDVKQDNLALQRRLDALEKTSTAAIEQLTAQIRKDVEAEMADKAAVAKSKTKKT